eukprot:m.222079 g.222079  ORF g.222079 m.222079 type:complete len:609 (-) comp17016_c0_seq5:6330-8156(-)
MAFFSFFLFFLSFFLPLSLPLSLFLPLSPSPLPLSLSPGGRRRMDPSVPQQADSRVTRGDSSPIVDDGDAVDIGHEDGFAAKKARTAAADSPDDSADAPSRRSSRRPRSHHGEKGKATSLKQRHNTLTLEEQRDHLQQMKGKRSITQQEVIHILLAYVQLKIEGKQNPERNTDAQQRVAKLLGHSTSTVSRVWSYWKNTGQLYVSASMGNYRPKETRIARSRRVVALINDFVRSRQAEKQKVTASQIRDELATQGYLSISRDESGIVNKKDQRAATVAVQRLLNLLHYARDAQQNLMLSGVALRERKAYARQLLSNRALPLQMRLREVYVDERSINLSSLRQAAMLSASEEGPPKPSGQQPKTSLWITAVLVGPNPLEETDTGGILLDQLQLSKIDADTSQESRSSIATNFHHWFEHLLLPSLKQPSLVVVDSSHNHVEDRMETPHTLSPALVEEELHRRSITFAQDASLLCLRALLEKHIAEDEKISPLARLARKYGHEVLFVPSDAYDLQPVDAVWAQIQFNLCQRLARITGIRALEHEIRQEFSQLADDGASLLQHGITTVDHALEQYLNIQQSLDAESSSIESQTITQELAESIDDDDVPEENN